jgi:glucose/arabinose dehydrogenase
MAGKILRLTDSGTAPSDNPISGRRSFAYGLRNVFGFDFDPRTGVLWAADNGPDCNDEIDIVPPGRNLGWGPSATCSTPPPAPTNTNRDGPNPVRPRRWTSQSQAPTGTAFCAGCGLGAANEGNLLYAVWETGAIRRVTLSSDRMHAPSETTIYNHRARGPLSLEAAPNGTLYLSDQSAIYRVVLTP